MNSEQGMFQVYLQQKEQQLLEQQAAYAALQREYFQVVDSSIWRHTRWLRALVNRLRGGSAPRRPAAAAPAEPGAGTIAGLAAVPPRVDAGTMLRQLAGYDVISFDLFDTLLLRCCAEPRDVFDLVAQKLGMESFARLRPEAEAEARRRVTGSEKEVSLAGIYQVLGEWLNIDTRAAMRLELETESAVCTANPFMKKIFDTLRGMGKTLILTTDMYLPRRAIEQLLTDCGYFGYDRLYISSEVMHSKASGALYRHIAGELGGRSVIHVGDNYTSDVEHARRAGWEAYYYPAVRSLTRPQLRRCASPAGSLCAGLSANRLCSGQEPASPAFAHGYACGGILAVGYCRWLERFAAEKQAEKLLFLARDSEIFDVLWRTHIHTLPCRYMVISRFAMWQLVFDLHTEEYIRFFFFSRAQAADTTIGDALTETGLELLLEELSRFGLQPQDTLDARRYPDVRGLIYACRQRISDSLAPQRTAAAAYFNECFGDARRILVSDVGWSGQILLHLRHFVRDVMHRKDVELTGAYLAASAAPTVNPYVNSGVLNAYLFTYGQNRDMYIPNDNLWGNTAVMCFEAMFSSAAPTLMRYLPCPDGHRSYCFEYGEPTGDAAIINEVQRGILHFAADWFAACRRLALEPGITAADAFAPYESIALDWPYLAQVFGDFKEYTDSLPRLGKSREQVTLRRIMLQRGLL